MAPLDESKRLERLQERQREWEEAWRQACEKREKAGVRKKNPQSILPRIVVTEYEFVLTCDEHVNSSDQSCDIYTEECYKVICRPVQYVSDENIKTRSVLKQRFQHEEPTTGVCVPYTALGSTNEVTAGLEKKPESIKPPAKESRSFDPHVSLETENSKDFEDNTRLDKLRGECTAENNVNSISGENAGIIECDENASKIDIMRDSILMTSCSSSGSSLDSGIPDMRLADNTGRSTMNFKNRESACTRLKTHKS